MEDIELKQILASYQERLEATEVLNQRSFNLNQQILKNWQTQKANSKLQSLIPIKIIAVILGIVWVMALIYLIAHSWDWKNVFFLISAAGIALITIVAIAVYIYHIVLLRQINWGDAIVITQQTIVRLRISTLRVTKILFLQSVFYCTFWWNTEMIINDPAKFWLISFPVALLFLLASLWLYKNISLKNIEKKWFRILFSSPEWRRLSEAARFLNEIKYFER